MRDGQDGLRLPSMSNGEERRSLKLVAESEGRTQRK